MRLKRFAKSDAGLLCLTRGEAKVGQLTRYPLHDFYGPISQYIPVRQGCVMREQVRCPPWLRRGLNKTALRYADIPLKSTPFGTGRAACGIGLLRS